ncbi:hypothetical protein TRIUR3_14110 [Triticum urartu]|uniref:Uncharacterized protein n=1 Tax=Triticum urartu TaxID=4572 RepID=M7YKV5_TRIUA|nr:uncharacterized protein LOC125543691 isoform X3 [Triticum urartu]EMS47516.1 hypothetical protein TRIUR3_14110 [Triticum urartu]
MGWLMEGEACGVAQPGGSETPPYNDVECCPRKESVPRFACVDRDFINVASILLVNLPFPLSDLAYGHWVLIASMSLIFH